MDDNHNPEEPTIQPQLEVDQIEAIDDLDVRSEESAEVTGGTDVTPWSTTHGKGTSLA